MVSLGIFSMVPPTEPCALRSTQPLKVSNRDFSWGKGGRCVWLTTYHPCSAETLRKSGALTYSEHLGPPRPVLDIVTFTSCLTVNTVQTVVMLYIKIILVYAHSHKKHINTLGAKNAEFPVVTAGGTFGYRLTIYG